MCGRLTLWVFTMAYLVLAVQAAPAPAPAKSKGAGAGPNRGFTVIPNAGNPLWELQLVKVADEAVGRYKSEVRMRFYDWLLGPDAENKFDPTMERLGQCKGFLECLREAQETRGLPPKPLPDVARETLQWELDVKYMVCLRNAVMYRHILDLDTMREQCRNEFTVLDGDEEMRGALRDQGDSIRDALTEEYAACRKMGLEKKTCEERSTVKLDGQTYKPKMGFLFQGVGPRFSSTSLPSKTLGDSFQDKARNTLGFIGNAFRRANPSGAHPLPQPLPQPRFGVPVAALL